MVKCPKCGKEVSELDKKCKYCGFVFGENDDNGENTDDENYSYVSGYNVFLFTLALFIFFGGIILGEDNTFLMFTVWISGIILLTFINLQKNILQELRKLNDKIDY